MDLETIRNQPHLSASSIKAYLDCGLQFKFSRIDKLEPTYTSDNLMFGSTIHRVLADYNQEKIIGNRLSANDLDKRFEMYFTQAADQNKQIRYSKGKSFKTLLTQGKNLIRTYINDSEKDEYEVLAVEEPFQFVVDGVDIALVGVMDLVERDSDNTVIISDYKTMKNSSSINEIDNNFQLTFYYMAAKKNGYSDREIVLKLDCLIKTKTPRFEQIYTYRDETDEYRAIKKIKEVWRAIQKGIFLPTAEGTWKCDYCEYKTYCDDWFMN